MAPRTPLAMPPRPTNMPHLWHFSEVWPKATRPPAPPPLPPPRSLSSGLKRAQLIHALSYFKPVDATPLQYYNYLRELCIVHECSIDRSIEKATLAWPKLTPAQRLVYATDRSGQDLPMPVPTHLLQRARQLEREGRWWLGREDLEQQDSKCKACRKRGKCNANQLPKRTQTPPEQRHRLRSAGSLQRILSAESVQPARRMRKKRRIVGPAPKPKKTAVKRRKKLLSATRKARKSGARKQRRPRRKPRKRQLANNAATPKRAKRGKRYSAPRKPALPVSHSYRAMPATAGISVRRYLARH